MPASTQENQTLTYQTAGVDTAGQDTAMPGLRHWIERSFLLRPSPGPGTVQLPLGYFANVIDIGGGVGLALSTDGVGTKALVAQMMDKYDTIGIDCMAMNVNDVLCVGAEPLALLDYVAVEAPHADLLEGLARGLYRAAEMAGVTIPGGEIAQMQEIIKGAKPGHGFDLVGSCVGIVPLDRIIHGRDVAAGDVVVGLRSSGVHSNGLTLARRVFFDHLQWQPDRYVDELGRGIGEELLEPTVIYVREVLEMLRSGIPVKALAHITSSGFLNLTRADIPVGFVLDNLPEPQPVFALMQSLGQVSDEEMFLTYNMGVGFCVVVAPEHVEQILAIAAAHDVEAQPLGRAVADADKRVHIPSRGLVGCEGNFVKA